MYHGTSHTKARSEDRNSCTSSRGVHVLAGPAARRSVNDRQAQQNDLDHRQVRNHQLANFSECISLKTEAALLS